MTMMVVEMMRPFMAFEYSSFRELKLGLSDNKVILDIS